MSNDNYQKYKFTTYYISLLSKPLKFTSSNVYKDADYWLIFNCVYYLPYGLTFNHANIFVPSVKCRDGRYTEHAAENPKL